MARGYHWFGNDPHVDDFTFVILDLGMASARYIGGMLKGGAHGINPELGHIKVALEPAIECYCGGSGCVATYSTVWGIATRICEQRGEQTPYYTELPELFRRFVSEARAGDVGAQKIFELAGHQLGLAMASHINASDPGRIIMTNSEPLLWEMISVPFYATLRKNILPALSGRTPVDIMSLNESELMWKGTAALVLEQLYRLPR
jgi:predicted NBD/HSP70 family sugar kinase